MNVCLTRHGLLVDSASFEKEYEEIQKRFAFTEKTGFAARYKPETKKAYKKMRVRTKTRGTDGTEAEETETMTLFPVNAVRYFAQKYRIRLLDGTRLFRPPDVIDFGAPKITLYRHQELILEHALKLLPRRANRLYLQLGTGMGKTFLGSAIAGRLGVRTLVVTPTCEIRDFWVDEFRKMFPGANATTFTNSAWAKIERGATGMPDMMAGVINSVRDKHIDVFENFGLVILDEAHEYYTPVNSNVLWCPSKYLIGLSATPEERPDELDRFVFPFIGRPVLGETVPGVLDEIADITFQGAVRRVLYSGDCPDVFSEEDSGGGPSFQYMSTINNLIEDPYRTHIVCLEVLRLLKQGHSVFVFAELREFLPRLQRILAELLQQQDIKCILEIEDDEDADDISNGASGGASGGGPVNRKGRPKLDSTVLRGGCKHDDVEEAKNLRIVLTTYGFSRRGISITNMTGMVLATPRRNGLRQIVGRILRLGSDPAVVRCVADIVDKNSTLARQFYERKKVYDQKQYPITKFSISKGDEITSIPEYMGSPARLDS